MSNKNQNFWENMTWKCTTDYQNRKSNQAERSWWRNSVRIKWRQNYTFLLNFDVLYLSTCQFSVKPYNKLRIDYACSACTSEISDLDFCADLDALRSARSVLKNIHLIFYKCRRHARPISRYLLKLLWMSSLQITLLTLKAVRAWKDTFVISC